MIISGRDEIEKRLIKGSITEDYFPYLQPDWHSSATSYSNDSFWCI
ncbi:MAG: hypothetical protein IMF12_11745 [Proteobacteria bacterium]|nr:hypothetical protein [Pseudomonadota bacterium]